MNMCLIYVVLGAFALYAWHNDGMIRRVSAPSEWGVALLLSLVIAAFSFGCDILIGMHHHPGLPPLRAALEAGGPFGFGLTLMACPGLTMLAIAGLLRSLAVSLVAT